MKTILGLIKFILILFLIFVFFAVLTPPKEKKSVLVPEPKQALEVTSDKILADYINNNLGAEEKYYHAVVTVSGKMAGVSKDIFGLPYLLFTSKDSSNVIQCLLTPESTKKALTLEKGQTVKVRGLSLGKTLGSVVIDKCEIL